MGFYTILAFVVYMLPVFIESDLLQQIPFFEELLTKYTAIFLSKNNVLFYNIYFVIGFWLGKIEYKTIKILVNDWKIKAGIMLSVGARIALISYNKGMLIHISANLIYLVYVTLIAVYVLGFRNGFLSEAISLLCRKMSIIIYLSHIMLIQFLQLISYIFWGEIVRGLLLYVICVLVLIPYAWFAAKSKWKFFKLLY